MENKKQSSRKNSIQCITVLFVIMVISGLLLSMLNDVLAVSEDERLSRAIKKIYGKEMTAISYTIDEERAETENSKINKIYNLEEDGNKIFNVTGLNGYKGGSITLWIVIEYQNDAPLKINKVVLDSYDKQTRMGDFSNKFYSKYSDVTADFLSGGGMFSVKESANNSQNIITGATYSSTAANNAVNGAILYLWGVKA